MSDFDLCILGAGPAGYAAAMRAHDLGKKIALVEGGRLGGAGLHNGALSSKTMWHLANDFAGACKMGRGFQTNEIEVSYRSVIETVHQAVEERRSLMGDLLGHLEGKGVTLFRGMAHFKSQHEVQVVGESTCSVVADNFLIATGSKPRVPDGIEVDGDRIVTSDHIESWDQFPESLVIVGSGVVGCEYATIFGQYARTKIFMIDRRDRILPFEDTDVSECIAEGFEDLGITIHRKAKLESMQVEGDRVVYELACDGKVQRFEAERALISIGRVPHLGSLQLDAAGVQLGPRGGIEATRTRTSVSNIFAAGDVTMDLALANVAELEGRFAVEEMFGLEPTGIDYRALSTIMFLAPEVASVGLGEQQAQERGIAYRAATIENHLISRNVAMRSTRGFIKLLAAEDNSILGLRVVGPQASSCIQGMALLIGLGGSLQDIARCAHPHPAVTEGVQECARLLLGQSVLKPDLVEGAQVSEYRPQ